MDLTHDFFTDNTSMTRRLRESHLFEDQSQYCYSTWTFDHQLAYVNNANNDFLSSSKIGIPASETVPLQEYTSHLMMRKVRKHTKTKQNNKNERRKQVQHCEESYSPWQERHCGCWTRFRRRLFLVSWLWNSTWKWRCWRSFSDKVCVFRILEWEMHPNGSEVVFCLSGRFLLQQEHTDGSKESISLEEGEYAINPPGTWHTADVTDAGEVSALFITCGQGTEHRSRNEEFWSTLTWHLTTEMVEKSSWSSPLLGWPHSKRSGMPVLSHYFSAGRSYPNFNNIEVQQRG